MAERFHRSRWGTKFWLALIALALVACGARSQSPQTTTSDPPPSVDPAALFPTLPPGTALPTEGECATRVRRSSWEPRPENYQANNTIPANLTLKAWEGHNERANRELLPRITGNFTGTTDEILQWGACKWGIDENLVRAVAVQESDWRQAMVGDIEDDPAHCASGYSIPCPTSFGITQVRWYVWPGTFPHGRDSTALAVDYWGGLVRSCYEGYVDWLHSYTDAYVGGDLWGCVGFWYAGRWYNDLNQEYIAKVRQRLANMEWLSPTFTERGGSDQAACCERGDYVAPGLERAHEIGVSNAATLRPISASARAAARDTFTYGHEARSRGLGLVVGMTHRIPPTLFQHHISSADEESVNKEAAWMWWADSSHALADLAPLWVPSVSTCANDNAQIDRLNYWTGMSARVMS